ncbi:MAG TPA: Z1 domain-containing protein [Prolixibacteraceae bacterium]|jgi:hypothetical protein
MAIYPNFIETKGYSLEMQDCIETTVDYLLNRQTNVNNPGMLLGKIQSGKTRTFIGIVSLSFDRGYDICIVFTKGTKALAEQTYQRLENEFHEFIENDEVKVYNIMNLPPQLTPYIRRQKLILVVKKETNNLDRLVEFYNSYPDLVAKRTLLVDDEADFGSVGFRRDRAAQAGVTINVLASKINDIRANFEDHYNFLQVTATPYSLYLQPRGEFELNNFTFQPIRPAFTTLVPIHDAYIGGLQYFEESQDAESVYSDIHVSVPDAELKVLTHRDQRYINNILSTPNLLRFRLSILNYLVGGSIRIIDSHLQGKNYKSSFIIHTATSRDNHQWQIDLTDALIDGLTELAINNSLELSQLIEISYNNISVSIQKNGDNPPPFDIVLNKVKEALRDGFVGIIKINSENQITSLLDRNGQLRLDNPFNIFIGGQILDRGITVENLIGFFYGRNPNTFQQDTVLQHSRMYGARSIKDMAVTRLYTSNRIYRAMLTMHQFDSALREAFERGIHEGDDSVIFIERDNTGGIRPCAPNKILITATETIRPLTRFLPIGFQTKARTHIQSTVHQIDQIIENGCGGNYTQPFLLNLDSALQILDLISSTYDYEARYNNLGYEWDVKTHKAILRRLVDSVTNPLLTRQLYCFAQTGRDMSRMKNNNTAFTNSPDNSRTDLTIARTIAQETPCLILLKQLGRSANGWRDAEFWWPIIVTPINTRTAVFASETLA